MRIEVRSIPKCQLRDIPNGGTSRTFEIMITFTKFCTHTNKTHVIKIEGTSRRRLGD